MIPKPGPINPSLISLSTTVPCFPFYDQVHYEMPWWRCNLIMWITLILGWARHSLLYFYLGCAMERRTSENGFKDVILSVYPLNPCSYSALIGTLLSRLNEACEVSES